MTKRNHWCDVCCEAVDWVGVTRDNQGKLTTICRLCLEVLKVEKAKWYAEGLYSKTEKVLAEK